MNPSRAQINQPINTKTNNGLHPFTYDNIFAHGIVYFSF